MSANDRGKVMTVLGPVDPGELGITLMHEHLLIDLRSWQFPPRTDLQRRLAGRELSMDMLGEVRRDPYVFEDNLVITDIDLAAGEAREFAELGGRTIVDVTNTGLGQRPDALRQIAEATGLQVIAGCGYYVQAAHPPEVAGLTVDEIAAGLIRDVEHGLLGTDVRPGVIGEIGTGEPVLDDEWKVLEAACHAQRETGLPLSIHVHPMGSRTAPEVIERVLGWGVSADRVIICHMDGNLDIGFQRAVAETGVYVAYDSFGLEVFFDCIGRYRVHDSEREKALVRLLEDGYAAQLVLSQDVCMKAQLRAYGGYGYDHVLRHIVPGLERRGVDKATIDTMLVDNPRRVLTIDRRA